MKVNVAGVFTLLEENLLTIWVLTNDAQVVNFHMLQYNLTISERLKWTFAANEMTQFVGLMKMLL